MFKTVFFTPILIVLMFITAPFVTVQDATQTDDPDVSTGQPQTVQPETSAEETEKQSATEDERISLKPLPPGLAKMLASGTSLNPDQTVVLDAANQRLLLHTQVACEDCPLEMFCCTEQTKEHESILWLRAKAYVVHAGLLALGARPGKPVTFSPEFIPPSGQQIDVFVNWIDKDGKQQRSTAQSWMRRSVSRYFDQKLAKPPAGLTFPYLELRYDPYNKEILWYGHMTDAQRDDLLKKSTEQEYQTAIRKIHTASQIQPMQASFVFAGSFHFVLEDTGEKVYAAEGGYLICVANFSESLMDVKEASSAGNEGRSYEAWPGKVPPRDTPVVLELIPVKPGTPESKNGDAAAGTSR